jgi:hypothetical protein
LTDKFIYTKLNKKLGKKINNIMIMRMKKIGNFTIKSGIGLKIIKKNPIIKYLFYNSLLKIY